MSIDGFSLCLFDDMLSGQILISYKHERFTSVWKVIDFMRKLKDL